MSNGNAKVDRTDHQDHDFKTPPLTQASTFPPSQQPFFYYYPPKADYNLHQSMHSNGKEHHLMTPPNFDYLQLSPQRSPSYKQSYQDQFAQSIHQEYFYPQNQQMYQHSYLNHANENYSSKKNSKQVSPYINSNHQSPRKQKSSNPPGIYNRRSNSFKSPIKSKKKNLSPQKSNNEGSRMESLTTNTNIQKKFIKDELKDYNELLRKLDFESDDKNAEKHELVTKINTLNCLQSICLKLLKEPVFDILYELNAKEYFDNEFKKKQASHKRNQIEKFTEDLNIDKTINKEFLMVDKLTKSFDDSDFEFEALLKMMKGSLINDNKKSVSNKNEGIITSEEMNLSNSGGSSGRMVFLNKHTNFFVSSKKNKSTLKRSGTEDSQTQKPKISMMKRTLKLSNNFDSVNESKESKNLEAGRLFKALGDTSLLKSNGSSNFNKLIETSPKKLMAQDKGRLEHLENTSSSIKTSRSLLSKNNLVLNYENRDRDFIEEQEHSYIIEDGSSSVDNTTLNDINDSSFGASVLPKQKAKNKKLRSLQNTNLQNQSAMDLSFDGKAMNKSDLFKLIDSFEL
ncbi:hypothetical protein QEN19_003732 [Hanseniaspora menglaensis]